MAILFTTIWVTYLTFILLEFKGITSFSQSYYELEKIYETGRLFQFWLGLVSMILFVYAFKTQSYELLVSIIGLGLVFVAPQFHKKGIGLLHTIGAIITIVGGYWYVISCHTENAQEGLSVAIVMALVSSFALTIERKVLLIESITFAGVGLIMFLR